MAWTVAGGGPPFTPVAAVNASIAPGGLATDAAGNVYIRGFQCVLKVDPHGILTLVAGNGRAGSPQDGVPATSAHLSASGPIATDPMGNIYTVDPSIRVRRISVNGTITTVAGNGTVGSSGDGGPATSAQFSEIQSLAADGAGNLYVVDASGSNRVRRVSANGIVTTVAGNGTAGFSGDGGPATSAALNIPLSLATDTAGNLYIAETFQGKVVGSWYLPPPTPSSSPGALPGNARFQVTLARPADGFARFARALPPFHLRALAFEFLVDGEEVLDFAQIVREHLVDGVDLVEAGIVIGYGQNLLVRFVLVHHDQHPHRTHQHEDSGIARLVDQRQDVERIAVFRQRPGNEAVVAGLVYGRIEGAVQAEHAERAIVFVLVGGALRDLHNHADNFGAVAAGVDIV